MTNQIAIAEDLDGDHLTPLFEVLTPVELSAGEVSRMRNRLLSSLKQPVASMRTTPNTVHANDGEWEFFAPLITMKVLRRDEKTMTALLKFLPNAVAPSHHHILEEECFILEGEIYMGDILLRTGDYQSSYIGTDHPAAHTQTGCLMLLRTHATT